MMSTAHAEIDLDALVRNFRRIADAAAPASVAAVVKADGYGLGAGPVASTLAKVGCERFFVATVGEGVALRNAAGLESADIFVLDGLLGSDTDEFVRHGLVPVLSTRGQVQRWADAGRAALHVDTGMNRLGLAVAEVDELYPPGGPGRLALLMTHLACADEPTHALNAVQLERFARVAARFPGLTTSIGNSAGALSGGANCGDVVRAGIALYGGNPFIDRESPVEPVVKLRAPVIRVRRLPESEPVGYGASFVADAGTLIATVAIGYADGYPRALGNCGIVAIAGHRVPVIGRVSMDLICVDVTALPAGTVEEGTPVELFGDVVSVDEAAGAAGTISYELLTGIGPRVERRYVGGGKEVD